VTVDGRPVETGTISLQPTGSPGARGTGGAINAGKFELKAKDGLPPGKLTVAVQASKKTGRLLKDPQRGDVPELASLTLIDSPKEVELSSGNAGNLALEFSTGRK